MSAGRMNETTDEGQHNCRSKFIGLSSPFLEIPTNPRVFSDVYMCTFHQLWLGSVQVAIDVLAIGSGLLSLDLALPDGDRLHEMVILVCAVLIGIMGQSTLLMTTTRLIVYALLGTLRGRVVERLVLVGKRMRSLDAERTDRRRERHVPTGTMPRPNASPQDASEDGLTTPGFGWTRIAKSFGSSPLNSNMRSYGLNLGQILRNAWNRNRAGNSIVLGQQAGIRGSE